jgi:hypothetical protein
MLMPTMHNFINHLGDIRHIPATVRIDRYAPLGCIGSLVWVEGLRECRLAVVVAVANGGRWVAAVDTEGGFISCRVDRLHFVCPGPFRTRMAQQFKALGLPVGIEAPAH